MLIQLLLRLLMATSILLFINSSGIGQTPSCDFSLEEDFKNLSPEGKKKMLEFERNYVREMSWGRNGINRSEDTTVYVIPIVVQIVHPSDQSMPGSYNNPADTVIQQAIEDLNDLYRNRGDFAGDGHNNHPAVASQDIRIEFCLAQYDLFGNPSTGIERYANDTLSENAGNIGFDVVAGWVADQNGGAYNPLAYLNIYLVSSFCNFTGCAVGWAFGPGNHGQVPDGVFVTFLADYLVGHEIGHYFNLAHTFGGGCTNNNCLEDGDRVCDTPPDNTTSDVSSCGDAQNSCSTDTDDPSPNNPFTTDQDDLYENYMDYGRTTCYNTFTQGQKDRMRMALTEVRTSLTISGGCTGLFLGCTDSTAHNYLFYADTDDGSCAFCNDGMQNGQENGIDCGGPCGGCVVYVDSSATGANDGSSWFNAYSDLHDALSVAGENDTLYIAKGTYYPTSFPSNCTNCSSPRDVSFFIDHGLNLRGGFPSGGGIQNITHNATILSGDIGVKGDSTDNCFHVLRTYRHENPVYLEGLQIKDGQADSTSSVRIDSPEQPLELYFRDGGSAIHHRRGPLSINNCVFDNNTCNARATVYLYSNNNNNVFENCQFKENQGGVMLEVFNADYIEINACTFNREIKSGRAAIDIASDSALLVNNLIFNNNISGSNGVILLDDNASPSKYKIVNNTLYNNSAFGIEVTTNVEAFVYNSIIWGHFGSILDLGGDTVAVMFTDIQGGYPGTGNMNILPVFEDVANYNFTLDSSSLLIDAGSDQLLPVNINIDAYGQNRIVGSAVDMGAIERQLPCLTSPTRHYVDSTASGLNDGTCWFNAFNDLTDAIDAADYGDTILIAKGTYLPGRDNPQRTSNFYIQQKMTLIGGYQNGGGVRDISLFHTILSGNTGSKIIDNDNTYKVLHLEDEYQVDTFELNGLIITKGYANGSSTIDKQGGAIRLESNCILNNVTILDNYSELGGPIYFFLDEGILILNNSTIADNESNDGEIFENPEGFQIVIDNESLIKD